MPLRQTEAGAEGNVHFDVSSPLHPGTKDDKSLQFCSGISEKLNYSAVDDRQTIGVTGPMSVRITNADHFLEPATVVGLAGQTLSVLFQGHEPPFIRWDAQGEKIQIRVRPRTAEKRESGTKQATSGRNAQIKQ